MNKDQDIDNDLSLDSDSSICNGCGDLTLGFVFYWCCNRCAGCGHLITCSKYNEPDSERSKEDN